jgi:lipopolysaccharide transport system permease protein
MAKVTTYQPDNTIRKGFLKTFLEIFIEIKNNRWLTWQLFKRDFLTLYKQSFLGIFWIVLVPLFSFFTFILLNRAGIFSLGEIKVPYAIYAVLGLAFWQIFASGLIACSNTLVSAGSMIVRINFSKKSLVVAAIGQALVAFVVQLVIVLILFIIYGVAPTWQILLIPIFILPLILITLGLGFFFALLNGVMSDIGKALPIFLSFLMFLSPILYARPAGIGLLSIITDYNPFYYLSAVPRDLILFGGTSELSGYLISIGVSAVIFFIGIYIFHLTETRVAERV